MTDNNDHKGVLLDVRETLDWFIRQYEADCCDEPIPKDAPVYKALARLDALIAAVPDFVCRMDNPDMNNAFQFVKLLQDAVTELQPPTRKEPEQ